jgi:hypothetical protein
VPTRPACSTPARPSTGVGTAHTEAGEGSAPEAGRRWLAGFRCRPMVRSIEDGGELDCGISERRGAPERALGGGGGSAEELTGARPEECLVAPVIGLVGTGCHGGARGRSGSPGRRATVRRPYLRRRRNTAGRRWWCGALRHRAWQPRTATATRGFGPRAATRHSNTGGQNGTSSRRWTVGRNDGFIPAPKASGSAAPLGQ